MEKITINKEELPELKKWAKKNNKKIIKINQISEETLAVFMGE